MTASDDLAFSLAAAARKRRRKNRKQTARVPACENPHAVLSPTQKVGRYWESQAAELLQANGLSILACNLRCKVGEIDLVALEPCGTLVFIEVRHRMNNRFGHAAHTVTSAKQQRLMHAAQLWLPRLARRYLRGNLPPCRFDVIGFDGAQATWIKAAF